MTYPWKRGVTGDDIDGYPVAMSFGLDLSTIEVEGTRCRPSSKVCRFVSRSEEARRDVEWRKHAPVKVFWQDFGFTRTGKS